MKFGIGAMALVNVWSRIALLAEILIGHGLIRDADAVAVLPVELHQKILIQA
jgi:hypothetical protein